MTKVNTRRQREDRPTEEAAAPRVKRVEVPEDPPLADPPSDLLRPTEVELVEGSTYELHGVRFALNRPVVVTDGRILTALRTNSRFRVRDVGGER